MEKILYIDNVKVRLKYVIDSFANYYANVLDIKNRFQKNFLSCGLYKFVIIHNSYFELLKISDDLENAGIGFVTFSGFYNNTVESNGKIKLNDVTVQTNLGVFLDSYLKNGIIIEKILLYGKFYQENLHILEKENEQISNINNTNVNQTNILNKYFILSFSETYNNNKHSLLSKYSNQVCPLFQVSDKKLHSCITEFSNKNISLFLIPLTLSNNYFEFYGIKLALHIRLTKELHNNRFSPIIFLSSFDYNYLKAYDTNNVLNFVKTKGCKLISYESLKDIYDIFLSIEQFSEFNKEEELVLELNNNNIIINPPVTYGRHNIANEWGAYRMAFSAGMIDYQIEPLYMKYKFLFSNTNYNNIELEKNINTFNKFLDNHKGLNILLIDDEYEKWSEVLNFIFKSDLHKNTISCFETFKKAENENYKTDKYDLVFLDLRLTAKDFNRLLLNDKYILSGQKILNKIKSENPALPIIIFTASNKIWFLDKQIQLGADGYFIKESLEFGVDDNYSYNNYIRFINTIQNVLEKSVYLRKLWKYSDEIKSFFFKNKLNSIEYQRIMEKLDAAFGVLKLKRSEYDENHYLFSDFELAFIIYWSILGEIFALNIDDKINTVKIKYDNSIIIKDSNFRISYDQGNKCFYVKKEFNNLGEKYDNKYDNMRGDKFKIAAVILLKNMKLQQISQTELKNLSKIIIDCNKYRNKLEYIHSNAVEIYKNTVLENRKRNIKERKEKMEHVFKLIYYLLTNKIINEKII